MKNIDPLKEDLLRSGHGLDEIERLVGKPIRRKITKIRKGWYSILLINKCKLFAQKIGDRPGHWQFTYDSRTKDTGMLSGGGGYEYMLALERDFVTPLQKIMSLINSYDVNHLYSDDSRVVNYNRSLAPQIVTLWKVLSKDEKRKLKKNPVILYLNL